MIIKFTPWQAQLLSAWADPLIMTYLRHRYEASWQWYWLNWEQNQELLI